MKVSKTLDIDSISIAAAKSRPNHLMDNIHQNPQNYLSIIERFKIHETNECIEWNGYIDNNGYGGLFKRTKEFGRVYLLAHRLSYLLAFKHHPNDLFVCHKCDNRVCINPKHLFLGTAYDNNIDKIKKGRSNSGNQRHENNGAAKLLNHQVRTIKEMISMGYTGKFLAFKFNVSESTISSIKQQKTWINL